MAAFLEVARAAVRALTSSETAPREPPPVLIGDVVKVV